MQKYLQLILITIISFGLLTPSNAQRKRKGKDVQKEEMKKDGKKNDLSSVYSGLKFRSIGPALMSGRIADVVIHPTNENTWYVAVASGGVWKTENAGTTWKSIFDGQVSYSIGCVTLDPQNPEIVWVGTGAVSYTHLTLPTILLV